MNAGILIGAIVVLLCILLNRLSDKIGVPMLLFFMVLGMVFGSDGLVKIHFDDYRMAETICSFALIFIMFYGGFGTNWKAARPVAVKAGVLSTAGVVLTAFFTGLFCYFVLGFDWRESFLVGAVISSTDAASVFSILRARRMNLKYNTASLLELESGSNDPMSYMLTVTAIGIMNGTQAGGVGGVLLSTLWQMGVGLAGGVLVAFLAMTILKKVDLSGKGMDTIFLCAAAAFSYALPAMVGGNGYLGAYLAGILLGNSAIGNKAALVHFFDGITGLAQIQLFFLLGLLAFPSQMPQILLPALAIALCLTFVSRPAAMFLLLGPMRCPPRQIFLVSAAGLRGAASIVFAIMATASGTAMQNDLFHIVFCVSLFSVALQGTLLPLISRRLDMVDDGADVRRTFNDYQEEAALQLMQIRIDGTHPWKDRNVRELNLPAQTLIVMVRRGKETLIPKGNTFLREGDLVILSGERYRDDGGTELREILADSMEGWTGRQIREISLPEELLIVAVKKTDGTFAVPGGETKIESGDVLVVSQ